MAETHTLRSSRRGDRARGRRLLVGRLGDRRFAARRERRARAIYGLPKTLGFGRVHGVDRREQVRVIPPGAGTSTCCGRFGSGNFGPPARGSFTISRFVMSFTVPTFNGAHKPWVCSARQGCYSITSSA